MGLKHKLTKLRMLWTHFMWQKRGGRGLNANISFRSDIKYTIEAYICAKIAYYARN
jgi:hypothetical protein